MVRKYSRKTYRRKTRRVRRTFRKKSSRFTKAVVRVTKRTIKKMAELKYVTRGQELELRKNPDPEVIVQNTIWAETRLDIPLQQGPSNAERIGNKIRIKTLSMNWFLDRGATVSGENAGAAVLLRFLVVRSKFLSNDQIMLDSLHATFRYKVQPVQMIDDPDWEKVTVLYDTGILQMDQNTLYRSGKFKMHNLVFKYEADADINVSDKSIWLVMFGWGVGFNDYQKVWLNQYMSYYDL